MRHKFFFWYWQTPDILYENDPVATQIQLSSNLLQTHLIFFRGATGTDPIFGDAATTRLSGIVSRGLSTEHWTASLYGIEDIWKHNDNGDVGSDDMIIIILSIIIIITIIHIDSNEHHRQYHNR